MKKIRLDVEKLEVESFQTGKSTGPGGTVRARSGGQIMHPSDWNPMDCASGVDTGTMCTCGQSHSGQPESCDDFTCIHGC